MSEQTDTLALTANEHTLTSAIQWLEHIAIRENWSSALTFALTLSLDEALTNIMSYAFQITPRVDNHQRTTHVSDNHRTNHTTDHRRADRASDHHRTNDGGTPCSILLRCTLLPAQIQIAIFDNGRPYDPTQHVTPPLPESLEQTALGGHGLRLMRHYVSDITYRRHRNQNCLTLTADLVASPPT